MSEKCDCCCCSEREAVVSDAFPKAMGPYSTAIKYGPQVFVSGQVGRDPVSGKIVDGGVEAETRQILVNMGVILTASGSSLAQVLKTTVFLRDINDFAKMNAVYAEFFPQTPPARSTIQVAALPGGVAVEIELVAAVNCSCDCGGNCDCEGDCDCGCKKE